MALTIAVNGCCIESMEDFVTPWEALPSGDCDRCVGFQTGFVVRG
jgi:hypothetical protein